MELFWHFESCSLHQNNFPFSIILKKASRSTCVIGRHFTAFNDNKALVNILSRPRATIPLRIERLTLRLQGFNFDLTHLKGENDISDYPSRHSNDKNSERSSKQDEYFVYLISRYTCPKAITLADIKLEIKRDTICQYTIKFVQNDSWYKLDLPNDFDVRRSTLLY